MTDQQPAPPPAPERHLPWRLIIALVIIALLVIAGFQNVQSVEVDFLWWSGSWPLIWILVATVVASIVASDLFRWWWRRRSSRS